MLICRECYRKATGQTSRVETVWSQYLDTHLGTDFLVGSDQSLRSLGGCSRKRPDKLYASLNTVEIDECDEHQHQGQNGNYRCDETRLSELYDDPSISGKKLVVIRWNPHSYEVPNSKDRQTREQRLKLMVQLKRALRANPPSDLISVYYVCYSADSDRICRNYPVHLIYDREDIQRIV
jgi:hypothetical protein